VTVRIGETVEPELVELVIWGALTWAARLEAEDTRLVCLCAAEATTDFCLGLDASPPLRVAAGSCEGAAEGRVAGG
jgi:hypothetical protein